ncbi:MAG: hypothetical protein EBY51_05160, partial [Actinobacteria bacterium]|nr:hypothetical protein [Actinomycetota bacterium]
GDNGPAVSVDLVSSRRIKGWRFAFGWAKNCKGVRVKASEDLVDERLNATAARRKIVRHDQGAHAVSPFVPIPA